MIQNNPSDSKDKNFLSINSSDSSNQFFINNKTLASPNFPMLNNGKIQPNLNFSSTSDNANRYLSLYITHNNEVSITDKDILNIKNERLIDHVYLSNCETMENIKVL